MTAVETLITDHTGVAWRVANDMHFGIRQRVSDIDVDDLYSYALLGLWQAAKNWISKKLTGDFGGYAYRVAKNKVIDYIRFLYGREAQRMPMLWNQGRQDHHDLNVYFEDSRYKDNEEVIAWIKKQYCLNARQKKVLCLRFGFDFTLQEIADELGFSESRAGQVVRIGCRKLRENKCHL